MNNNLYTKILIDKCQKKKNHYNKNFKLNSVLYFDKLENCLKTQPLEFGL